jgi:hypothetical protein
LSAQLENSRCRQPVPIHFTDSYYDQCYQAKVTATGRIAFHVATSCCRVQKVSSLNKTCRYIVAYRNTARLICPRWRRRSRLVNTSKAPSRHISVQRA